MPDERLYRRPDSRAWWCWFYDRSGRLKRKSTKQTGKRAAALVLRRLEEAAQSPTGVPAAPEETYSVSDALGDFVELGMTDIADDTQSFYRQKAGHLERLLGPEPCDGLNYDRLLRYYSARVKEGASRGTVVKEFVTLRRALKLAVRREQIAGFNSLIFPEIKCSTAPRDRWLTEREYLRLLMTLASHHRDYVRIAVYTGGRKGELDRLETQHVDLERGWLLLPGRKTRGSLRHIPIEPPLRRVLDGLDLGKRKGRLLPKWGNVDRDLRRACERINKAEHAANCRQDDHTGCAIETVMGHVSCNDLRRTFASWMLQKGVPVYDVSKLMGHGSTMMVERIYGHLSKQNLIAAVRAMPDPEHRENNVKATSTKAGVSDVS